LSFGVMNSTSLSPEHTRKLSDVSIMTPHRFKVPATHTKKRLAPLDPENPNVVSYQGLLNLALLLFVASDANLFLENVRKYGVRISSANYHPSVVDAFYTAVALAAPCLCTYFAFYYERRTTAHQGMPSLLPHIVNLFMLIAIPSVMGFYLISNAGFAVAAMLLASTQLLKVYSWVMTNRDLRAAKLSGKRTPYYAANDDDDNNQAYPKNVTLEGFLYFLAVPTLCYQPSYPRTERIRWKVVMSLCWRLLLSVALMFIMLEQYALPALENSLQAFGPDGEIYATVFFERVLKLSASAVPLFLTMFYALFHCHLNLMAELTCFADREFYQPWWNSATLGDAWRYWNIPVHDFCKRHIYIPLRAELSLQPLPSMLAVFAFSALMHELLVAVPAKKFLGHAFVGFLLQVPLIAFTEMLRNKDDSSRNSNWRGNIVVWLVFIVVGWPALALLYYHAWATRSSNISY